MKHCPHCGAQTFSLGDLWLMDSRVPSLCAVCEGMVFNPLARVVAPALVAIALMAVGILIAPHFRTLAAGLISVGLLAMTLGRALWAKPTVFNPKPKFCRACGRDDVGYFQPGDEVCADCTERLEREKVFAEQRELESQPGYRLTEAVAREKARLLKGTRSYERPNEEL